MNKKSKTIGVILFILLLSSLLFTSCGSGRIQKDTSKKVDGVSKKDDGLKKELHHSESTLLKKDYVSLTKKERQLFDILEKGEFLSEDIKKSIESDITRLSKEKEEFLANKRDDITTEDIVLIINDNLTENDSTKNVKIEGNKITADIYIDGFIGDYYTPNDLAADAYMAISNDLIFMNEQDKFWHYLIINFFENNGEELGIVEMKYSEIKSDEYGTYFPPEKIERQLGIYN